MQTVDDDVSVAKAGDAANRTTHIISSAMPASEIIAVLANHRCYDVTGRLDLNKCGRSPISGGGFGDVYQGTFKEGMRIAIKCARLYLPQEDENGHKILKRAARELHTWSRFEHENVLGLLGLAQFRDQVAMISPWVDNGTLLHYISCYPTVDRYQLCVDISSGVAYLHQNDAIHGDIKSANVLVSSEGVAKLADFGCTQLRASTLHFTTTTSGSNISMRWAAPEILAGEGTRTKEADVYALGMTLLEAVTGAVPFSGKDDIAVYIAVAVKQQMPERPEEFPSFTSDEASRIWEIIVDSCAYRSSARPGSSAIRNRLQNMRQRPKELAPELTTNVFNAGTDGFEAEVQMYLSAYKDGETTAGFFAPGSTDSADIIHTSPRPIYIEDGSNNNNSRDPVAYAPRMVAQLPQSEKEQGSQNNTTSSAMSFVAIDPLTTRQKLAASMLSISSKPWFRGRRVFPRSQQQAELPNPSSQEEYSTRYHNDQREQTPQHKSHSGSPVVPLPSPFGFTPPTLREVGMSPSRPSAPAWYSDEELAGAAKPTPPPRKLHGPRIESLTLSPTSALPESLDRQSPVAPSTLRPAVIPPPTPLKRLGLSHLSTRLASPVSERSAALGAEKPAFQTPEPVVPPQLPSPAVEEPEPVLENLSSPTPRASADSGLQDTEPCEEEIKKEPEVPTQELSVEYYKFRRSYIPATVNPPHLQRPIATSMGLAHTPNVKAHNRPPRRVSSPPQPRNLVTPRQRSTIISSPGLLPGHPRTPVALIAIPMPLTDARVRARGYGETYVPPIPHIDTPNRQSRQPARRMSASLSISSTNAEAGLSSIAGSGDSKG